MISALGGIGRQENMVMSVGPKEVGLYHKGEKVIERKVPLPVKWIKRADYGTDLSIRCGTALLFQSHTNLTTLPDSSEK